MNKIFYFLLMTILSNNSYSSVGIIAAVKGNVKIISNNSVKKAVQGLKIKNGDKVETKSNSYAKIIFDDNSMLDIEENSLIKISYISKEKKGSILNFIYGKIKSIVGKRKENESYEIKSGSTSWGIRGTELTIQLLEDEILVQMWDGSVEIKTKGRESALLEAGNFYTLDSSGSLESRQLTDIEIQTNTQQKNQAIKETKLITSKISSTDVLKIIQALSIESIEPKDAGITMSDKSIEKMKNQFQLTVKQEDISIVEELRSL